MTYPTEAACPQCGVLCAFTPRPDTPHYGEIRCPEHNHNWISRPSEDKKPRRKTNAALLKLIPETHAFFCWRCLRTKEYAKLLNPPLIFQVHHIIPIEEGGTDDPSNLQLLCHECHADIHRFREAVARYSNLIP